MGMAMGGGTGAGRSPVGDAGPGPAGPGGMAQVMQAFQQLLTDHAKIKRTVEDVPGGVVTVTTSEDPVVAATIRAHVRQMKKRLETGQPLRMWDPLFVELFRHHDQIEMEIEDIPGGVKVTETSQDTHVALLVRQHARRGVSEFVARGWDRAHEPTPLPDGYGD